MPNDFDVAVVGAGPAGAWAAYWLAKGGARVAIVDGSHPREKACGGGLSARALELLTPIAESLPAVVRATLARFASSGVKASVRLPCFQSIPALAISSRTAFDVALLHVAEMNGAQHVPRRVTAFERRSGGWMIETDTVRLSAGWLVGADGANSLVRRRMRSAFPRRDLSVASGYYVRGQTCTEIDIEFTDAPAGYLWSFPREDHLAVGICGQADETSSGQLLDAARRWIVNHTPAESSSLTRYSWPIPTLTERTLRKEHPCGDRWLLAGDAAGLVDPITREGIFFALQSGEFAARSILGAQTSATYLRLLRTHIYSELGHASRIKTRFFGPSFRKLLVQALNRSDRIGSIMADLIAGRQTYRGLRRRLLMTGELRLAFAYLRLASH